MKTEKKEKPNIELLVGYLIFEAIKPHIEKAVIEAIEESKALRK